MWGQLVPGGIQHPGHLVVHVHKRHVWPDEPGSYVDDANRGVLEGGGEATVTGPGNLGRTS